MPLWILYAVPTALSAAATLSFLCSISADGARGRGDLTFGLLFLLAGSLIATFPFLGVRIPLVQSVSKRWIEPWGYFGYIPIFAAAVPFVIAGLYFIKRSFT